MKESYSEDLASHAGPESYAGGGNTAGVATTGEHTGQPLSSEITLFVCRSSALMRRQHHTGRPGKAGVGTAESETLACVETLNTRTGRSGRPTIVNDGDARRDSQLKFTSLLHHVNEDCLTESFYHLKKSAAVGVDGVTWADYEQNMEANIADLHDRIHRGGYRAKPSRRVWIPKANGRQRPLGIASLEDKIVQQAVLWVLQSIYEQDFRGFSYGFRPGRGTQQALAALSVAITSKKVNWIDRFRARLEARAV